MSLFCRRELSKILQELNSVFLVLLFVVLCCHFFRKFNRVKKQNVASITTSIFIYFSFFFGCCFHVSLYFHSGNRMLLIVLASFFVIFYFLGHFNVSLFYIEVVLRGSFKRMKNMRTGWYLTFSFIIIWFFLLFYLVIMSRKSVAESVQTVGAVGTFTISLSFFVGVRLIKKRRLSGLACAYHKAKLQVINRDSTTEACQCRKSADIIKPLNTRRSMMVSLFHFRKKTRRKEGSKWKERLIAVNSVVQTCLFSLWKFCMGGKRPDESCRHLNWIFISSIEFLALLSLLVLLHTFTLKCRRRCVHHCDDRQQIGSHISPQQRCVDHSEERQQMRSIQMQVNPPDMQCQSLCTPHRRSSLLPYSLETISESPRYAFPVPSTPNKGSKRDISDFFKDLAEEKT